MIGRGCVDQVRQVVEKPREKRRKVYMEFLDLEKAYGNTEKEGSWEVLLQLSGW